MNPSDLASENADLRRRLAEREAELAEALAQQTATAEVLGVINASPGDLAPVFDAMLDKAMDLCGAAFGALMSYDGETVSAVATRGLPPELADVFRTPLAPRRDGDAPYARFLRGEPLLHIVDMAADDVLPSLASRPRALVDIGRARTGLEIPLRKEGTLRGSIWLYRQEVRPFSDKQISLLQNFAAQAVIAMENARLITETREALAQQTATAEVLGVINSSPGDLAPVFDATLDRATHLCGATFGVLNTYDGERFHTVATRGVPTAYAEYRAQHPHTYGPGTFPGRILSGERVIHIADLTAEETYRSGDPGRRALVDLGGAHATLVVALVKDSAILGFITVYRQEARAFSDNQIALLQNFAAQAVVAMENARLITETREALEQQTATAEVLGVINASPGDLTPVFETMLDKAMLLCEAAYGVLLTCDGKGFQAAATRGLPAPIIEFFREPLHPGPEVGLGRMLLGESLIINYDMAAEAPYIAGDPIRRAMVDLGGARSAIQVALRRDGALLGAITVYRQEVRPFSERQVALIQNFAAQAVIAMENARLLGELRDRTRDLQESLEYQTATSEVLKVISRSDAKLEAVLGVLVETAARICEANHAAIHQQQGDLHFVAASFGTTTEYKDYVALNPIKPSRGTAIGRMALDRRVVHIEDALNDPEYTGFEFQRLGGFRTLLAVPLFREDVVIGSLLLTRSRVEPFTEKQIALVTTFADQAAIAFENARLLGELRQRTEEVAELNRGLEARVAEQVEELGRVGRLKRFLAPQLAELIVSQGDEEILESHRREIVVVFCDLRGYTAFTETAEPEEVLDFLREYHGALGPLVAQFEGTLDQFSGDGIMVFFNDPIPCADPAERAVKMAVAMREAAGALISSWRRRGRQLGFGVGIAQGYATLGQIGFAERSGYTAIGTVCNLAARLCAEAKDGQILIAQRVAVAVEQAIALEEVGELSLKGLTQPVVAYNVPVGGSQTAFRVIEGGAPTA